MQMKLKKKHLQDVKIEQERQKGPVQYWKILIAW